MMHWIKGKRKWILSVVTAVVIAVMLSMWLPFGMTVDLEDSLVSISFKTEVAYAATESLAPTGQVQWTNLDGDYTDIDDDPDSPDGNWGDAVDDSLDVLAHISFPTPTGNPTQGAGLQNFKVQVKRSTALSSPTLKIDLYESGAFRSATSVTASSVTSDAGELFTGTWDASSLGTADGSVVEAYVYGTKAGAASTVTVRSVGESPGADSTSCVIVKPVGLAVGDLMIVQCVATAVPGTVGTWVAPVVSPVWNTIRQDIQADSDSESTLFWKIAVQADVDATNFTFTNSGAVSNCGTMTAIYGHNAAAPINQNAGVVGLGTSWTCPTITPSVANCMLLLIAGIEDNTFSSGWGITTSDPGGWLEAYDLSKNLADDLALAMAYAIRPETSATGAGIGITGNDTWTGQILAIAPATATYSSVDIGAVEWNVDYTVGVTEITVSPTSYDFGQVNEGSTTNTTTNYFAITNSSTIQTDQTIGVTTTKWSGGLGWDHNDSGVRGDNATAMYAYRTSWDVVVKNAAPNYIYENCPASTNYTFGLSLLAPNVFYEGAEKTITVRITASPG